MTVLQDLRVLVVENDEMSAALLQMQLVHAGATVVGLAASVSEALRLLETDAPVTLLFTDMVMPEMNGRALAEQALRLRPGLKVLFTTGYAGGPAGSAPGAGPGGNLLPKPFDIEQLAVKLREVLDG